MVSESEVPSPTHSEMAFNLAPAKAKRRMAKERKQKEKQAAAAPAAAGDAEDENEVRFGRRQRKGEAAPTPPCLRQRRSRLQQTPA